MNKIVAGLASACCSLLLVACGGGGGGSGGGGGEPGPGAGGIPSAPATADGSWLTLTPDKVSIKAVQGQSSLFTVRGASSRTFASNFNILVLDPTGTLSPDATVGAVTPTVYDIGLKTSATLAAGKYSANVEVRICEDDPRTCARPFPGSPWRLPVDVEVASASAPQTDQQTGGTGSTMPGIEALKVQPAELDLGFFETSVPPFGLNLFAASSLAPGVFIDIVDPAGLIAEVKDASVLAGEEIATKLKLANFLKPGSYETTLEVRACRDRTATCAQPLAGSPLRVPVKIRVKSVAEGVALLTDSVQLSIYEDETPSFDVGLQVVPDVVTPILAEISDKAGLVKATGPLWTSTGVPLRARVTLAAPLKPGNYETSLELRFCTISQTSCAGSPADKTLTLPVKVAVKSTAAAIERVSVQPGRIGGLAYDDEATTFGVTVGTRTDIGGPVWIRVTDPTGLYAAVTDTVQVDAGNAANFKLQQVKRVAAGDYATKLAVDVCREHRFPCERPLVGSPWTTQVNLKVLASRNLSALKVVPGVGAWSTLQGNAGHTGHVAATFKPANFTRRWRTQLGQTPGGVRSMAIADGRVFVTQIAAADKVLAAVREDTGQYAWRTTLGALYTVNAPAAGNGKVYVTSVGHEKTFYWQFDATSGELQRKSALDAQWSGWGPPTPYGADVYTESGYYGGMSKFDATGALSWSVGLPQFDSWSPAVDADHAYAFLGGSLHILDKSNGRALSTVPDPDAGSADYTASSVVLSGTGMAYVYNAGHVSALRTDNGARIWSTRDTTMSGMPAYANGVLYLLNARGTVLEARDGKTGKLSWTSQTLSGPNGADTNFSSVILTDNLAFVSSSSTTLAIDLSTHRVAWTFPRGGTLALSDRGVLYILDQNGELNAVNLR